MVYTVIYAKEGVLYSTVVQSDIDRTSARQSLEKEYGDIVALIPGSHPVYF
tara:strand:- start:6269 stop:6421 length:153 start_codon:yes stop_codon:yes gene_type:complete